MDNGVSRSTFRNGTVASHAWWSEIAGMKLLVYDSASSHLARHVLQEFEGVATRNVVVPSGLTPILQHIAFVFRHQYQVLGHEWETVHPTTKLNAAPYSILAIRLCAAAWQKTLRAVDVPKSFLKSGYLWPNDDRSHIALRGLSKDKVCPENAFH